ncbi:MAG TPA: serine/threonine-protein kinase, partial [Candidatus Krumholzibacteria bacterium]|nr:serine/threonine-protein kinase [Candidatus Krumholzibacteria bacterium]
MRVLGERYDVIAPIGAGTAATVFRVRDRRSGVVRAAKVLTPANAREPETLARFEDEYRILRSLHHPHLPEIYDYGFTDDGGRFLVMELVDGDPLDAYFRAHPRDLWLILYQIAEVLTFVHNHHVLHQDIKPANLLVKRTTAFGEAMPLVKLIDFGLTHRRDTGASVQMVGTPAYMAPEVVRGEAPLTRAVDYYSLGVSLYELLAGRAPFVGTVGEILRAQLEAAPVIEHEELEWAELYPHLRALLAKDKRARLEAFEE